jgi:hypothetical protein
MSRRNRSRERGQAAVETAITLPLALFMVLGTLQLFLMLQARLMTEHAVFKAARAGSLSQGSCQRMRDAALLTLLPTFTRTDSPARVARAYELRRNNRYVAAQDSRHNGAIVWINRGLTGGVPGGQEDFRFDDPDRDPVRLNVQLVYWYPLRIPFANWIIARMMLAVWGLQAYTAVNPVVPIRQANWQATGAGDGISTEIQTAFRSRANNPANTWVFPIQATYAMRMMTPARTTAGFFNQMNCPR